MKLVVVMVTVLLVIVMIAGCSSRVQTPSNVTTQAPGAVIPVKVEASQAVIVPVGPTYMSPDNETPNNTRHNDVFFLEPVKDYHVGDNITVHGTTILSAGDPLLVEVVSSSFGPAPKSSSQSFTGVSGIVPVKEGVPGGPNSWSFSFPTDGFIVDTYIVTVSGISINVGDSTTFQLKPRL